MNYRKTLFVFLLLLIVVGVFTVILFNRQISQQPTDLVVSASTPISAPTSTAIGIEKKKLHTIVIFGDSITAGYGISISEAFPKRLEEALISRGINAEIINSGVTGETTAGGLRRASFVAAQKPEFVVIALGGNDVLRGIDPSSTKANLADTIKIFQQEGIKVVLAGMKAPTNLGPTYVTSFDNLYPQLANEYAVPLVPFLLEGVALIPELNQADGIHPNQTGAKIIAEKNILPVLLPLLY